MLYHFLFESLDESFKATILLNNHNYQVTVGTYTTEDGSCLLKQTIVRTFIDTRTMASQIRGYGSTIGNSKREYHKIQRVRRGTSCYTTIKR